MFKSDVKPKQTYSCSPFCIRLTTSWCSASWMLTSLTANKMSPTFSPDRAAGDSKITEQTKKRICVIASAIFFFKNNIDIIDDVLWKAIYMNLCQ